VLLIGDVARGPEGLMLPLVLSVILVLTGEGAAELSDCKCGKELKGGTGGGDCFDGGGTGETNVHKMIWQILRVYSREPENSMHSLKCDIRLSRPALVRVSKMINSFLMIAIWRALSICTLVGSKIG